MRHPDSYTARWPLIWFAKYSLYFGVPLVFLVIAFWREDSWFIGLSTFWAVGVAILAWQAVNEKVSLKWRVGLAVFIFTAWTYCVALVVAGPGDTTICYDELRSTGLWTRTMNLGPSPYCAGTPLQDVQTD